MAKIAKCDNCSTLNSASNPVDREHQTLYIRASGLDICITIPHEWQMKDLCADCCANIIKARFADLCGMIAPYQPQRVAGFIQAPIEKDESAPMTKSERKMLADLSRRLLGA
jgi:hypothetical protein